MTEPITEDIFHAFESAASEHEKSEAVLRSALIAARDRLQVTLSKRRGFGFSGPDFQLADHFDHPGIWGHFFVSSDDGHVSLAWQDPYQAAMEAEAGMDSGHEVIAFAEIPYGWLQVIVKEAQFEKFVRALTDRLRDEARENDGHARSVGSRAIGPAAGVSKEFMAAAETLGYGRVLAQWSKAQAEALSDPDGAIGLASTLIESTCQHVLATLKVPPPQDISVSGVYGAVKKNLGLDPAGQANDTLKGLCRALQSVAEQVGALRTHHSEAHGQPPTTQSLTSYHARLAVDSAGVLCTFLMRRLLSRGQSK